MTSSPIEASAVDLHQDQRGAMMVAGMFMCFIACGFLFYIVGIGNALLYREGIQDSADTVAFTGAVLHARGMTLIVLLNIIMAALMAILVLLRAVETILIAIMVICGILAVIPWTAAFGSTCLSTAEEIYNTVSDVADEVDDMLEQILPKLNAAARGLSMVYPWIAEAKSVVHASELGNRNKYSGSLSGGFILSKSLMPKGKSGYKVGLPIEEDTSTFWGRTKMLIEMMFDGVPFMDQVSGIIGGGIEVLGARAHLSRGRCDDYNPNACNEQQPPGPDIPNEPLSADMFDDEINNACDEMERSCNGEGDTYEGERDVANDQGQVTGTEHFEGNKQDHEYCDSTSRDPDDSRCDPPPFSTEMPVTCPQHEDYDPNFQPSGVYECWDHPELCSTQDGNGQSYGTDDDGNQVEKVNTWQLNRSQCISGERDKVQQQLNGQQEHIEESQGSSSSSGSGSSSDCEGPKQFYCDIEHAGDKYFQIQALVMGKKPPLHQRKRVAVAAPGWSGDGEGLTGLANLARIGTAQSEFYFDDDNWANNGMWNFRWRARLRRFRLPEEMQQLLDTVGGLASNLQALASIGTILSVYGDTLATCAAHCDSFDFSCYEDCLGNEFQLPINRYQFIH